MHRTLFIFLDLLLSLLRIDPANINLLLASNDCLVPFLPLSVLPMQEVAEMAGIFQQAGSSLAGESHDVAQAADALISAYGLQEAGGVCAQGI